ncbi:MAG TPA: hypothetical protein VK014_13415 [Cyclobacteriaceae bacterium]|nr:hypothetical protein [Cyclobacteriaceae bacterium]
MSNNIDLNYLESYSRLFTEKVCAEYFGTKKYMNGQEIIRLTPINQINLMIIKSLFGEWQEELEKLKNNPYFDYKDYAVKEALKEFMNVLSRAIKIERAHFEPLMRRAVQDTVLLAVDPVTFLSEEIEKAQAEEIGQHFKDAKKYLKWRSSLVNIIAEKAGRGASKGELQRALVAHYDYGKDQLEPASSLLRSLDQIAPLDYEQLTALEDTMESAAVTEVPQVDEQPQQAVETVPEERIMEQEVTPQEVTQHRPAQGAKAIDPALAWAKFESEEYGYMKGSIGRLTESVALNQKFMFTKVLFDGNHDLMMHALKSVDEFDNFVDAIEFLNLHYVAELDWDIDSDEVAEFLQLIFRKFDQKK